jgi:diguanylate cyclase (GGDEF)-like protein
MKKKALIRDLIKKIVRRFLRLKIVHKLLLGYLPLIALTILTGFFALLSLENLNKINESIIKTDIPLIKSTEKMIESLYSQELYGNRYAILKSKNMMELFRDESKEFVFQVKGVESLLTMKGINPEKLISRHEEYNSLFNEWFKQLNDPTLESESYTQKIAHIQERLISLIKNVSKKATSDQNEKTRSTSNIGTIAFRTTAALGILSVVFGIGAAILITRNISKAIGSLKTATREISLGNFDHAPEIRNQDELGDLSKSFEQMGIRLKRLEEMYLDANPLTHLPGGIAIENVLKKRIKGKQPLAFCVIDLDNFKAFNDYYGYTTGNKVIKGTAKIIEEAISKFNHKSDSFIGHIGGDDFVIITSTKHDKQICNTIIEAFDKMVVKFYEPADIKRGYIKGKTRIGKEKRFPIMTISIAIVNNKKNKNLHHIQFIEKATELKLWAKSFPKSILVEERRGMS